jgi:hypothetical protein
MQTFLTKTSQKKIRLLSFLLENNRWCAMAELQEILGVSQKSILHYTAELTQIFEQYHGKITLKNDNNQRFYIEKSENFPVFTIYLHFYRRSYNYNLIDFMYRYPEKNLEDYAEVQFTSVSTVFRYAKLLIPYFQRYQLTFHTFKLELVAEEISIRSFFYYFYWNSTRDGSWPFQTNLAVIEEYITAFEVIYQLTLDSLQRRVFTYWLAINLERSRFNEVSVEPSYQNMIIDDPYFELLKKWADHLKLPFSKAELCFMYQIIYAFGIIAGHKKYEDSYAAIHEQANTLAYQAVLNLEQVLQQEFNFDLALSDRELMYNFVAFHERSILFFGNTDFFFNRSYAAEIKKEQPKVYEKIAAFQQALIKQANQEVQQLLKNWEQLFLDYYYVLDYYDLLLNNLNPIKILIQDDLHHTHRLWLMNKINTYFGHSHILAFYDYQTQIADVDLVISNYYLDTQDKPLLLMKNIPSDRNWRQLEQLLAKLMNEKNA